MNEKSSNEAAAAAEGAPFGAEYGQAATGEIERMVSPARSAARQAASGSGSDDPRPLGADPPLGKGGIDYLARPDLRAEAEKRR